MILSPTMQIYKDIHEYIKTKEPSTSYGFINSAEDGYLLEHLTTYRRKLDDIIKNYIDVVKASSPSQRKNIDENYYIDDIITLTDQYVNQLDDTDNELDQTLYEIFEEIKHKLS